MPGIVSRLVIAVGLAVASLATTADAFAWCRTAGCETGVGAQCTPELATNCGVALTWPSPCISYSLQKDASSQAPFETIQPLVRAAFDSWQNAACDGGAPGLLVVETDPVSCRQSDFNQDGRGNANVIVFRDEDWTYGGRGVLALTTVTYGLDTGTIHDADMEINTEGVTFSFGDEDVGYDFLSVVTHETGHFLGLAHSSVPDSTMITAYRPGSTDLRSLSTDDVAGICAIYPAMDLGSCDASPEDGLLVECADEDTTDGGETGGGCSVARGPSSSRAFASLGLLGVLALGAARARGARSRARRA